MNRLIIIGNGFDLAHGLKTSYCDFIEYYIARVLDEFNKERFYEDELVKIIFNGSDPWKVPFYITPVQSENALKILFAMQKKPLDFEVAFKSDLLKDTIKKTNEMRWVDLENDFFEELNSYVDVSGSIVTSKLILLNKQFSFLKEKLEEYLLTVQIDEENFERSEEMFKIFHQPMAGRSINGKRKPKILFLNFNYTNTIRPYLDYMPAYTVQMPPIADEIIHIHGRLGNIDNPIIFGFGDEHNKHYLEFEDLKNDELFRHIKSFAYFKTSNYHSLMDFLKDDLFEIFIVGHSCGLSDRTMFRQIFEHTNIYTVKIFYHSRQDGTNDYEDKTISLARHFTDKAQMRLKIVPKPDCKPIPQRIAPK